MVVFYLIGFFVSVFGLAFTNVGEPNFNEWLAALITFGVLYLAQCVRLHALRIKPMPRRK